MLNKLTLINVDSEQAASKSSNALNYIYVYIWLEFKFVTNHIHFTSITGIFFTLLVLVDSYNLFKTHRSCISDDRFRTTSIYKNFKQRNGIDDLDNLDPF